MSLGQVPTPQWSHEQRMRIYGQLMAPLLSRDTQLEDLPWLAELAVAATRELEKASKRHITPRRRLSRTLSTR